MQGGGGLGAIIIKPRGPTGATSHDYRSRHLLSKVFGTRKSPLLCFLNAQILRWPWSQLCCMLYREVWVDRNDPGPCRAGAMRGCLGMSLRFWIWGIG